MGRSGHQTTGAYNGVSWDYTEGGVPPYLVRKDPLGPGILWMKRDLAPWPSDSRDHDAKEKFVAGNTACPQKDRTSQSGEDHRDRDPKIIARALQQRRLTPGSP
ncbi:hypothetical protein S40288_11651 [Stachybotrys chartarum IBT 40288]|nr:hypothetical protein S40288_11651 [Stachybotrys chartarum IBT 40288]